MNPVSTLVGVHNVPDAVRALSTIREPNYVDFYSIALPEGATRSAEEWARAVLERSPVGRRHARRLWTLLGLRLGPRHSPDYVQGWKIASRGDHWIRIETGSWYMTAEALSIVDDERVSLSLSLRYDRRFAVLVWALVSGPHQRGVPVMLRQAAKLMAR